MNSPLSAWANFYVIVGSASAALIGIQFVVITLIVAMRLRPTADTINTFSTPNVLHFGSALLISGVMTAPWPALAAAAVALGACGLGGLGYAVIVLRRARRQKLYQPVWEDWLWYVAMPMIGYAALILAAACLCATTESALFVIGAVVLGLLLIAIRNAWDSITHIVITGGGGT